MLILSHDHDLGTVGLILNRPGPQRLHTLAGLKPDLAEVFAESQVQCVLHRATSDVGYICGDLHSFQRAGCAELALSPCQHVAGRRQMTHMMLNSFHT